MPHQLEAFKLAERGNLDVKGLSRLMLLLTVIAMPLCIFMLVDTFFELGVNSGKVGGQINSFGGRAYRFLEGWLTSPQDANRRAHRCDRDSVSLRHEPCFPRSAVDSVLVAHPSARLRRLVPSPPFLGGVYHQRRSRNGVCSNMVDSVSTGKQCRSFSDWHSVILSWGVSGTS